MKHVIITRTWKVLDFWTQSTDLIFYFHDSQICLAGTDKVNLDFPGYTGTELVLSIAIYQKQTNSIYLTTTIIR